MQRDDARTYLRIYRFMWSGLGLSGAALLVYARIYGYSQTGEGVYYESKRHTAAFLGISEREVFRAIGLLNKQQLITEVGEFRLGNGRRTKAYRINEARVRTLLDDTSDRHARRSHENHGTHVSASPGGTPSHDGAAAGGMTGRHVINKEENKAFR